MSSLSLESEIRQLAYNKWENAGCPFITSEDERNRFWFEGEKEILAKQDCCCDDKLTIKAACDFQTTQVVEKKSKKKT